MLDISSVRFVKLPPMADDRDPLAAGRAIEERRRELGLSAREAARRSGLTGTTIRAYERGESDVRNAYTGTLRALARALDWSLGELYAAIGIRESREDELARMTHIDFGDESVRFPVFPSRSAGDRDAQPAAGEVATFLKKQLGAAGVKAAWVRVFPWDDSCYVTSDAALAAVIKPGDYLAIDTEHKPRAGDVGASYWRTRRVLVLYRFIIEAPGAILHPADDTAERLRLPENDELEVIGRLALRTG